MKKKSAKTKDKPLAPLPELPETDAVEMENEQTMNQKKIALVQSGAGPVILEMIKDNLQKVPLVGRSQFETVKNAIIMDTSSTLLGDMVVYLEEIKKGGLIGKK